MKVLLWFIIICVLVACAPSVTSTPTLTLVPTNTLIPPSLTSTPTETPVPPTPTKPPATATATLAPPTETPAPACVTLIYEEYAQFEIIAPTGERVLVDVFDPEKLSRPASAADILLTTHTHWDHYNSEFQAAFEGEQLFVQVGSLELTWVHVQGIASAHNDGDALKPEGGTNYIYLIEIGNLRIVHFGDIGQKVLNQEQLAALDSVDIAIMQLDNAFSEMNAENQKGINLMAQVQPRLIIPTHVNLDTTKLAVARWGAFFTGTFRLPICEADLSETGTEILYLGEAAGTMAKYVELVEWGSGE